MKNAFPAFKLAACAAAVALEALPWGAVLRFAAQSDDGSIDLIPRTYSYFDPTPFGYANFGPAVTALLSCLLLAAVIVGLLRKKPFAKTEIVLSGLAFLISLTPLLMGFEYFSLTAAAISFVLALAVWLCIATRRPL